MMIKSISHWASQHRYLAISCEVANGYNGILLGVNCLENWPEPVITGLPLLLISGALALRRWAAPHAAQLTYPGLRLLFLGAFGLNFLLFVALGGLWGSLVTNPMLPHTALASRRMVMRADTIPPAPQEVLTNTLSQTGGTLTFWCDSLLRLQLSLLRFSRQVRYDELDGILLSHPTSEVLNLGQQLDLLRFNLK